MAKIKLSAITRDDAQLYFGNSVVRVIGVEEKPRWYMFHGFSNDGSCQLSDRTPNAPNNWTKIPSSYWKKHLFIDSVFPVGFFNVRDTVVLGSRIPLRQNTKGISGNNYRMESAQHLIYSWMGNDRQLSPALRSHFATHMMPKTGIAPQVFNEFIENPKYIDNFADTIQKIRRGAMFARAITKDFAMLPHPLIRGILICYHKFPIAEIMNKDKIQILNSEFRQEIEDLGLGMEVVQS